MAFAAPSAFAEFQYATSVFMGTGGTNVTASAAVGGAPTAGNVLTLTNNTGGAVTGVRIRIEFSSGVHISNPGLILYDVTRTGTVTVTDVRWGTLTGIGYGSAATSTAMTPTTFPAGPTAQLAVLEPYDSFSPTFTPGTVEYALAFITISMSAGASISLSAVSNPEPGTFALFALGTAVFGGLTWRRRRSVRRSDAAA